MTITGGGRRHTLHHNAVLAKHRTGSQLKVCVFFNGDDPLLRSQDELRRQKHTRTHTHTHDTGMRSHASTCIRMEEDKRKVSMTHGLEKQYRLDFNNLWRVRQRMKAKPIAAALIFKSRSSISWIMQHHRFRF